jgi:hypothetical protein
MMVSQAVVEKHKLQVFEDDVLRKVFWLKR